VIKSMKLTELLSAIKNPSNRNLSKHWQKESMTIDQVKADFKDFINQYVDEKYGPVSKVVQRINEMESCFPEYQARQMREDKCKICEATSQYPCNPGNVQ